MNQKAQSRAKSASATLLILVGGILVLLNVLGLFIHPRIDATDRKLFSLSSGSKHLVENLKDRMEITAYFSSDLPPPHNATERYVRDLLMEYKDASKGKIALKVVHPEKDEEKQQAEKDSVSRVQDQKLEADSFSVHEGYRGISFRYLGDSRAIAQVDDTDGLEYEITQIIKEMTGDKVKIGVLTGKYADPQPDPMAMQMGQRPPPGGPRLNSLKSYLPTYTVEEIKADKEISSDLKALLIVQPDQPFTENELRYIDQYVMKGGSLAVFGGSLKVDVTMGQPSGAPVDTGINKLLEKWGLSVQGKVVADRQCGRARMPTQLGIPVAVPYPPVPIITFEEYQRAHPVLFKLDQVALPYAAPIALNDNLKNDKEVKRTILAQSTKYSWPMEGATIDLKARERWELPKDSQSFVVGVALAGKLPSAFAESLASTPEGGDAPGQNAIKAPARATQPVHVLVFGSGYFMRDEFMQQSQRGGREIPGGAAAFALNAIDWLAQDSDMVEIRAKSVEDPALEVPNTVKEAEATIKQAVEEQNQEKVDKGFEERKASLAAWDAKKAGYRYGNMLGLPLAFALFGVVRWRIRKAKRANLKI